MVRQIGVADVKNRTQALTKVKAKISRLNKDPKAYKGNEVKLVSLKKSEDTKNFYIATIESKKKKRK